MHTAKLTEALFDGCCDHEVVVDQSYELLDLSSLTYEERTSNVI